MNKKIFKILLEEQAPRARSLKQAGNYLLTATALLCFALLCLAYVHAYVGSPWLAGARR